MRTIIYRSVIEWGFIFQRPQQLLREFTRQGYRAFFINPAKPVHPEGRQSRKGPKVVEVEKNLFVCRGTPSLHSAGAESPLLWVAYPPYGVDAGKMGEQMIIYDAIDLPQGEFSSWAPYVPPLREEAAIVFVVSPELRAENTRHHRHVHLCPNGVDLAHFAVGPLPEPADLAGIRRPIAGFVGSLAGWVDWALLAATARLRPDFSFVFIGPTLLGAARADLPQEPNIHYLGHRDYQALPAYLQAFSVTMLPFKLNPVTWASDPVKLYEYLAAGKPVVATPLPAAGRFPGILTGTTPQEWSQLLLRAVEEESESARAERVKLAGRHTWAERVRRAKPVIEAALERKQGRGRE